MISSNNIKVGGDSLTIQSLPATRSLQLAAKMLKLVGGIGDGLVDIPTNLSEFNRAVHVGNMVQGVLRNLDADGAPELLRDIVRESVVTPSFEGAGAEDAFKAWYETRFSRALQDLAVLLYEIFLLNYGDPVQYIKKAMARAEERGWLGPSAPSSETTSSE